MLLDYSCITIPSLQQRAPLTSTIPVVSNLFTDGLVNASLLPLLSHNSLTSPSQPTNDALGTSHSPTSSQTFTTSSPMPSQANLYPSKAGNGYLQQTSTIASQQLSIFSSSSNSETTGASTGPSSSTPLYSSLWPTSNSSSSGSLSTMTSSPGFVPYPTISPIPVPPSSSSLTASTTAGVETSSSIDYSLSADPSDTATASASSPSISASTNTITPFPTTLIISTTKIDTYSAPSPTAPHTSTLILTSVLSAHPSTTWTTTTSGVLSTAVVDTTGNRLSRSPGSIAGMILGVLGAIAFAVLWLFCARRRQRKLSRDAGAVPPWAPGGPLEAEVDMEERYAGILAALNAGMGAGRNVRIDDSGDVSVLEEGEGAGAGLGTRVSSPTLPPYSHPFPDSDDTPIIFPLSPPPPCTYSTPPPPSAYIPHASNGARRRSSPGPDASAWFGGYTVAPAPSNYSHSHSHSDVQFLRAESASSTHFLMRNDTGLTRNDTVSSTHFFRNDIGTHTDTGMGTLTRTHTESGTLTRTETGTRTRTGSEEPLLTRAGSGCSFVYGRDGRLGSAFGSPEGSVSVSGHGYGFTTSPSPSGTASSLDMLRSMSSQGALRSMDSHGFGFGSASSASAGSFRGPGLGLAIGGGGTSGFKGDAASSGFKSDGRSGRWKMGKRERESMGSCSTVSGSGDEKHGHGHAGVRAFFGRLRRGNTPSPSPKTCPRDVESEGYDEKSASASADAKEVFSAFVSPATPEPGFGALATPEPALAFGASATPESAFGVPTPEPPRFVLSNPDPRPGSPYIVVGREDGVRTWLTVEAPSAPAPVPGDGMHLATAEEMHLTTADGMHLATTDGLLDPRLRDPVEGRSNSSLRDFEDYSRPIGVDQ
ncbi:hypothetical protein EDD22DRAFT_567083 [Suillus occidentalis]|nr:hypothetical protein EDD22DRAFT_567083 [Suillus occidentalis]